MASRLSNDELPQMHDKTASRQRESSSSQKTSLSVLCILFVELCERLTFYGLTANLVFYCRDVLKLSSPFPSTITLAFQGKISPQNLKTKEHFSMECDEPKPK